MVTLVITLAILGQPGQAPESSQIIAESPAPLQASKGRSVREIPLTPFIPIQIGRGNFPLR